MKAQMQCRIHSKKLVDTICLDRECQLNPLSCFCCRNNHQDHSESIIHVDDFIETVASTYNVAYIKNEFSLKINKIRQMKGDLTKNLNQQKARIIQLIDQISYQFNQSIDSSVEGLISSYYPFIDLMQNLQNFNENGMKNYDSVLIKAKEVFKISKKEQFHKCNESNLSQGTNKNLQNNIQFEFLPSEKISHLLLQAQESYRQISDNLSKYLQNFEILGRSQISNFIFNKPNSCNISSSSRSSRVQNQQNENQHEVSSLSYFINNVNINSIKQELSTRVSNSQIQQQLQLNQQRSVELYHDEQQQIQNLLKENKNQDLENKFEKNDFVIQMNNGKIETSPQMNSQKNVPLFGTFQESIVINQTANSSNSKLRGSNKAFPYQNQNIISSQQIQSKEQQQLSPLLQKQKETQYTFRNTNKTNGSQEMSQDASDQKRKSLISSSSNTNKSNKRYQNEGDQNYFMNSYDKKNESSSIQKQTNNQE